MKTAFKAIFECMENEHAGKMDKIQEPRPLRKGEGHWVIDEWGQMVRKCNDSRSCYERMGEDNRKSLKRALRRFGPRGGI